MKKARRNNVANLIKTILPIFGAISLFWSGYIGKIPRELTPLISLTDANSIVGPLVLEVAAAALFGRFFTITVHFYLTSALAFLSTRNYKSRRKIRMIVFSIKVIRRITRNQEIYISTSIAFLIICLWTFEYFPIKFIFTVACVIIFYSVSLRFMMFRIPNLSPIPRLSFPKSISQNRVINFRLSWLILSILTISFFGGAELFEHRKLQTACLEMTHGDVEASILIRTDDFLISAKSDPNGGRTYHAVAITDVVAVRSCE